MPSARSRPSEPVGITWTSRSIGSLPSRMIAPLPNCLSIAASARSMALSRAGSRGGSREAAPCPDPPGPDDPAPGPGPEPEPEPEPGEPEPEPEDDDVSLVAIC